MAMNNNDVATVRLDLRHECEAMRQRVAECRLEMARFTEETKAELAGITEAQRAFKASLDRLRGQAVAPETRVLLDVGGVRLTTSVATLRTVPGSYFDAMVCDQTTTDTDWYADAETGERVYFIDRDGDLFRHILEFLRDGGQSGAPFDELVAQGWHGASQLRGLKREFAHFQLEVGTVRERRGREATFVLGGKTRSGEVSDRIYDPTAPVQPPWIRMAPMPTRRYCFGLCVLDNEVYACGGKTLSTNRATCSVERYTPATGTWATVQEMPVAIYLHSACAIDTMLYVVGGVGPLGRAVPCLRFDRHSEEWQELAPMPAWRGNAAVGVVGTSLFVAGGMDLVGTCTSKSLFKFDTVTTMWSTLACLPARVSHAAAGVLEGKLYVIGGFSDGRPANTLFVYDPEPNTWTTASSMPTSRGLADAFVREGRIFVVGGYGTGKTLCVVESYDPRTDTWTTMSPFPEEVSHHRCCTVQMEGPSSNLFDTMIARAEAVGKTEARMRHTQGSV
jgi:N-acetylneuraminic acid mutarotase